MSFLTALALVVGVLVAAPIAAHLLRRRRSEEKPFPPALLVPPTPPTARQRSRIEDRFLFIVRALAVLALALLGATPFVRCDRLSLSRQGGASVAIAVILDDSLSMRAAASEGGASRFERAKAGALELVGRLGEGDSVALVLAGAPPRVALAATTDMGAVLAAIEAAEPSDRATDLDEALRLGSELLKGLPQIDKRLLLLSDLADGNPGGPVLTGTKDVTLWAPLPELEAKSEEDCAVVRAERLGSKVHVRIACTPSVGQASAASAGRSVQIRAGNEVIRSVPLAQATRIDEITIDLPQPPKPSASASASATASATAREAASAETGAATAPASSAPSAPADWIQLHAALTGTDAIADDDAVPVSAVGAKLPIAIVVDPSGGQIETGGPPPVEQALSALAPDADMVPIPTVPDHAEDLGRFGAVLMDDVPGLTPEARRAVGTWVEKGGVLLLTLGPRAASAPLGAGFDPLVPGVVRWGASPTPGVDPASAALFGPSAATLADIAPQGRTTLDPSAFSGADVLAKWKDGAPFWLKRPVGRGAVLVLTLPFSTTESDFALRPAFLAFLDRFVRIARARGGATRIDAGESWAFDGFREVTVTRVPTTGTGARTPIPVVELERRLRATPPTAGLYEVKLDGETGVRVATVPEREIDLRARAVSNEARDTKLGGAAGQVDISMYVALALLALVTLELGGRAVARWRSA